MRFVDFTETARALAIINPSVTEKGYTVETLEASMVSFAYDLRQDGHFCGSTFGYVLSLYAGADGEDIVCKASVTAYCVERYLERTAGIRPDRPILTGNEA